MEPNSQSRKYILVIQNPEKCCLSHDTIKRIIAEKLSGVTYACMADEVATTGTPHTHLFIYSKSPIRFRTVKAAFPLAHIEKAYGSVRENRAYVEKSGKWSGSDKAKTSVEGTFEEFGDIPSERAEKAPMMSEVIDYLQEGMSTWEIIQKVPKVGFRSNDIEILRQTIIKDKYIKELRNVSVYYLYGETATGKTSYIFRHHNAKDICRITSYSGIQVHFDAYSCQPVLVFEEYHGQIPLPEMLNFLDKYPVMLPARYSDRIACYTTVYITSNLAPEEIYIKEQEKEPRTYAAFLRRLNHVELFTKDGVFEKKEDGTWEKIMSVLK